jgi:hypothetical protein
MHAPPLPYLPNVNLHRNLKPLDLGAVSAANTDSLRDSTTMTSPSKPSAALPTFR